LRSLRGARATVSLSVVVALLPVVLLAALERELRLPLSVAALLVVPLALLRVLRLLVDPPMSFAPSARAPSGWVVIWDGSAGSRGGRVPVAGLRLERSLGLLIEPLVLPWLLMEPLVLEPLVLF